MLDAIQKTPVTLVVLKLDTCGNVFGVAPCTATGEPCYNTFATCKDRQNYDRQTKEYLYTDSDAPLPFVGPRPYLKSVRYIPTEIKSTLAVKGRVVLEMEDEPETTDIGLDPYGRSVVGSYWRKLLARTPNYANRTAEIYEGTLGQAREELTLRWSGSIENIQTGNGKARIELVDPLKDLKGVKIPPELKIETVTDVLPNNTAITLTGEDVGKLPDSGTLRIEDEFIQYSTFNRTTNVISGLTRQAFGSTSDDYDAGTEASLCLFIDPVNPFDLLYQLLTNGEDPSVYAIPGAGIDPARINKTSLDYWRDWPGGDAGFSGLLEEPTDLEELVFEILDILDVSLWYSEGQQITFRRNLPNEPGRTIRDLTDEAHIVHKSGGTDGNDEGRYTRVAIFWDKRPLKDLDKRSSYKRQDIAVDGDAESPNEYGKKREKGIIGRMLSTYAQQLEPVQRYAEGTVKRRLLRVRDANPHVKIKVELKDSDILTGDVVALSTDEILEPSGAPVEKTWGTVVKRDRRGNTVELTVEVYRGPFFGFIADSLPDYDSATLEQRDYGYISDEQGRIDDGPGYAIY